MAKQSLEEELNRQVDNLLNKDYPSVADITITDFLSYIEPLRNIIADQVAPEVDLDKGIIPFVIVIRNELVPTETAMKLIERKGKNGITKLFPLEPKDFAVIDSVQIPDKKVYLLFDVDRGKENINLPPSEALEIIQSRNRFPLTIDEGIAIVTHYPEFLMKNNCFSLLASRRTGDKRVPALWINANKNPNLGWCWNGNPHTWLGSASCGKRL